MAHSLVTLTVDLLLPTGMPARGIPVTISIGREDSIDEGVIIESNIRKVTDALGRVVFELVRSSDLAEGSYYMLDFPGQEAQSFQIEQDSTWEQIRDTTPAEVLPSDRFRLLPNPRGEADGRIAVISSGDWVLGDQSGGTAEWEVSATAPTNPVTGQGWLDTSSTPPIGRIWNGTSWIASYALSASQQARLLPSTPTDNQIARYDAGSSSWQAEDLPTPSTPPAASASEAGLVELATIPEAIDASDNERAVTPLGMMQYVTSTVGFGTVSQRGLLELATIDETTTGTDTQRAVSPAGVAAALAGHSPTLPAASESEAGIVELATTAEVTAGTDTSRAVTSAGVAAATSALTLGATSFAGLTDTPSTLEAGRYLVVNSNGTELEFIQLTNAARSITTIGPALALTDDSVAHTYTFTEDPLQYDSIFFTLRAHATNIGGTTRSLEVTRPELAGLSAVTIPAGGDVRVPEALSLAFGRVENVGSLNLVIAFTGTTSSYYIGTPGAADSRGAYDIVAAYGVSYRGGVGGVVGPQGPAGVAGMDGADGAATFLELTDTPAAYVADRNVVSNTAGDALVFATQPPAQQNQIITPINFSDLSAFDVYEVLTGLTFHNITSGVPNNALNTPTELTFATPLTASHAGSFLTIEVEFAGDGTDRDAALYLGRVEENNVYQELDAQRTGIPFSAINPGERTIRRARLHTDDAELQIDGTYRWRLLIGSTTTALINAGTIIVRGTITEPQHTTLLPNAWHLRTNLGTNGYILPYRNDNTTFRTPGDLVAFLHPLNHRQASLVWIDIDISDRSSYDYRRQKVPVIVPMNMVQDNKVGVSNGVAAWDAGKVLIIRDEGIYGFGSGDELESGMVGIHFVYGDSSAPDEITHFAVVVGNSLAPWSRGRINAIYAL